MASRNFYLQVILRIALIVLSALGLAFCFVKEYYGLSTVILILIFLQGFRLIHFINHTNRKIAYFFDAIKNEDFTLHFPEKDLIKSFKDLNHSLNRVNSLIQEVHLKKQEQEQYYQVILKQANIGILTFNDKGHILFANPTVEKLLNYSPLNHIKQLSQIDEKLYGLFDGLKPFDQKLFQLTNEREKTQLAIKSTAISIDNQNLLLVVIQDIHKELDEKETDSWIKLIRVLTHEIMNTITPMTSISESILKYFKTENGLITPERVDKKHIKNTVKGLEVIREQGDNLMSFVKSYRTLLSVPEPDKEIVDVQILLNNVAVMINPYQENTIKIEIEIAPKDLELFIDKKQITQVLINLGKNALQSLENHKNGRIILSAGIDHLNKKFICISDNGSGIPQEHLEEIFIPFFTTKNTGTGIGLSLSKQILRLHGGTIKAYSIPFQETSFMLSF